jgi:hypothetical protein
MNERDVVPLIALIVLLVLAAVPLWLLSWSFRRFRRRGQTGLGSVALLGPLAGLAAQGEELVNKKFENYRNAEDALHAASQLDSLGEWDLSIKLYQFAAERWPEHKHYAENSINQIQGKQLPPSGI